MIEQEMVNRITAERKAKGPVRLPAGEFEKHYTPQILDSRSRYRQHDPVQPSSIKFQSTDTYPDPVFCMEAVKVEDVKPSKTGHKNGESKHFRRLTLGDISPEFEILWDDDRFGMGRSGHG